MTKRVLPLLSVVFLSLSLEAQTIRLSLPDTVVQSGDTLVLPIVANGFDQVVSVQFSIHWNPSVIRYIDNLPGHLNQVAIGGTASAQGILRFSWFDVEGQGLTLPDGGQLIQLRFDAAGQAGDFTELIITGDPLPVQIFRAGSMPGLFDSLILVQDTGSVAIAGLWQPGISVQGAACMGQSNGAISVATAGAPANAVFRWSGPGGFFATTPSIAGIPGGAYVLRVESAQGVLLYQTEVIVPEPPELVIETITATPSGCVPGGGSALITAIGGTSPYAYQLQSGSSQNTPLFSNLATGQYTVTATDASGCTATGSFAIELAQPPNPDLGDDIVLCPGESALLNAGSFALYLWSDGFTGPSLLVSQSGIYRLTVTDALGCTGSDSISVDASGSVRIVVENEDLTICSGDSLQLLLSGGADYRWIDSSGTLSQTDVANPVARPLVSTSYTVIASSACAADTAQIRVQVYPVQAAAGPDTCIQRGQEIQLFATGGVSYAWDRADYPLSSFTSPNPTVTPLRSTVFRVTVRDINGCATSIEVPVEVLDGIPNILLINLITPNGDGKNDVLDFPGLNKFSNNALKVYNRWGDLVYQKLGYQTDAERFDGTFQGKPLPAGNYFYVLSFAQTDFKQTLTIVRD